MTMGAFALLGIWGCVTDGTRSSTIVQGEDTIVELKLVMHNPISRAAGDVTEPADDDEKAISGDISILVYNSGGNLELVHTMVDPTVNGFEDIIKVKSGLKYFYVMANQDIVATPPGPQALTGRKAFEIQKLSAEISAAPDEILSITTPYFVMGTLWGSPMSVKSGGTVTDPVPITLEIGRASAKVKLYEVSKGTSNMKGRFEEPNYRLGSVPNIYYHVGQYDDSGTDPKMPPETGHGKVTSAVHDEGWGTTGNPNVQNDKFGNYTEFISVSDLTVKPLTNCFYAVENTTASDADGLQYYGNTTYVQLRTTYIPHEDEVVDMVTLEKTAMPEGQKTFYVVTIGNIDYIVPEIKYREDYDGTPKVYENGWNYHKFPIRDTSEDDPERVHAVLRNHYYEVKVTAIRNLGEPTDYVDPSEPITEDTIIKVEIDILDWSKISQSEEL